MTFAEHQLVEGGSHRVNPLASEKSQGCARPELVFLNRCFWPDAEATGQLLTDLCEYLVPRWQVRVVVGQPNRNLHGETFVRRGRQIRNGVTIERLGHTTFSKRRKLARLANLVSFTLQARSWTKLTREKPQVVICETDPFFLPLIAAPFAKRTGARFVVYVQDIYPDVAVALGQAREGMAIRQLRCRLTRAYAMADRIIVLGEDMRRRLVDWGLPEERITVISNWIDTDAVRPMDGCNPFRTSNGLDDRFVVMHSGNMGLSQRLDVVVEAFRDPGTPNRAVLTLVGDGAKRASLVADSAELQRADKIRFFDYQPYDRLSESLSAADLHLVSLDGNATGCLAPSKLYGILSVGRPVLCIAPENSELLKLVLENRIGWVAKPGDANSISQKICEAVETPLVVRDEMGRRARQLAIERYDRKVCCRAFEVMLTEVLSRAG